jgi:hypothetical protein
MLRNLSSNYYRIEMQRSICLFFLYAEKMFYKIHRCFIPNTTQESDVGHVKAILKYSLILSVLYMSISAHSEDDGLPKFLIIGAQKSGTGALYELLRQHPQIVDRPGEIHFFDLHFDQGIEWYQAQFPERTQPESIRGDKSPYYLFHPLVPERAHALLPQAKLIVLLRNPIDRAYSQYWMNVRKQRETLSFSDALKAEEQRTAELSSPHHRVFSYLSRGLYIEQLRRWLAYYPLEQMMVISSNDFFNDPQRIVNEILMFLDLPEYSHFNFQIGVIHSYPPMDERLRKELSHYFRFYNQELEALLDRSFNWD